MYLAICFTAGASHIAISVSRAASSRPRRHLANRSCRGGPKMVGAGVGFVHGAVLSRSFATASRAVWSRTSKIARIAALHFASSPGRSIVKRRPFLDQDRPDTGGKDLQQGCRLFASLTHSDFLRPPAGLLQCRHDQGRVYGHLAFGRRSGHRRVDDVGLDLVMTRAASPARAIISGQLAADR